MAVDYRTETEELYAKLADLTDQDDRRYIRNKIVELNIRLVSQVLKKYKPYSDDHFQNGCIGLIQAAETYEMARGVPFSSYACFCIERAIQYAYMRQQQTLEAALTPDKFVHLDSAVSMGNGDQYALSETIFDEQAQKEMEEYIQQNELEFVCNDIIRPGIAEVAEKGSHMKRKINIDVWQDLEFAYIMDLVFLDSQKQGITLATVAKESGVSLQNARVRHTRVMDVIFKRMWTYMSLPFGEMLERLRGTAEIPHRLLCLDPGKTTGWCLFEDGELVDVGQVADCYNDNNVDVKPLLNLMESLNPDFIVYEDYKVYSHKLSQHTFNPIFTVRLIGAIETFAQMREIPTHKQMAATAKGFVTDEKLKQWDFWKSGQRHGRDAIRQGCYFLLFYNRGKDIL